MTASSTVAGLEALKGTVRNRFGAVSEQFDAHLSRLRATAWSGNAKEQAVGEVTRFTTGAKAKVEEATSSLVDFIEKQLQALRDADQTSKG